jgi:ESCRT-II complex subunit VPS22
MCKEIGVDPLASTSLWNKNLNLSEFYYNLAIQIITISLAIRESKGALIELDELKKRLVAHRKKDDISLMDIQKAIESVSELKCGFLIIDLKNTKAVMTLPMQLSNDTNIIMNLASENGGFIGYTLCYQKTGISKNRFEATIVRIFYG